jgi:glycosyltransferase involved in cell wall biosynthesis
MSLSLIERVRRAGIPAVGVVGDDWMIYSPRVDAWYRMVRRLSALAPAVGLLAGVPSRVDLGDAAWLFNSQTTRDRAVHESGFDLPGAQVLHPGIDAGLFRAAPGHDWAWRLLYVGRLDERKGVDTAIECLAHLPGEATLTVLGSGDARYRAELRAQCARLGVEDRVVLGLRPRGELPLAYAEADALLFPARWEEPWGLVPLEAMAVGTPVIATGTGGSAEYLRHRDNALVVGASARAIDLAGAVRTLASDAGLRARLRRHGLDTAARYTEQGYNEGIEAALMRAVA